VKFLFISLTCIHLLFAQQIVKKPYLSWQHDTNTTITISWETDVALNSIVEYGTTFPLSESVVADSLCTLHHMELTGLTPNTTYYYRVSSTNGPTSEVYQFTTAYAHKTSFRFAIMGDDQGGNQVHQDIINAIETFNPDFLINTGDLVKAAKNLSYWEAFFDIEKGLIGYVPLMPARGNHDDDGNNYQKFFALPNNTNPAYELWYAFSYGNAYFIVLESGLSSSWIPPGRPEYEWLKSQLENEAQNYDWRFVVFHNPPYGSGHHFGDEDMQNYWVPLFEANDVDICFNGHNHFYERSIKEGVQYLTVGGGGAHLEAFEDSTANPYRVFFEESYHYGIVDIDGPTLTFTAYRLDGSVIEQFQITKDISLPIFLTDFQAFPQNNGTTLVKWRTESEIDVLGFNLYREMEGTSVRLRVAGYETNEELQGAIYSNIRREYEFEDVFFSREVKYHYWLEARFVDGSVETFGPTEVDFQENPIPTAHQLRISNYPNPFNMQTIITVSVPVVASRYRMLKAEIFDLTGRRVFSFTKHNVDTEEIQFRWDGKDDFGRALSSGIYLLRVNWAGIENIHKITLLK